MDLHRRLTSNHAVFARKQHDLACIARAECLHRSDRSSEHDAPVGPSSLDEAVGMQGPELPRVVRDEALVAAELGHPFRGRLAHQHLGAGYLEQAALVDDAEPVAEGLRLAEVVGHEYGRCSRAAHWRRRRCCAAGLGRPRPPPRTAHRAGELEKAGRWRGPGRRVDADLRRASRARRRRARRDLPPRGVARRKRPRQFLAPRRGR